MSHGTELRPDTFGLPEAHSTRWRVRMECIPAHLIFASCFVYHSIQIVILVSCNAGSSCLTPLVQPAGSAAYLFSAVALYNSSQLQQVVSRSSSGARSREYCFLSPLMHCFVSCDFYIRPQNLREMYHGLWFRSIWDGLGLIVVFLLPVEI